MRERLRFVTLTLENVTSMLFPKAYFHDNKHMQHSINTLQQLGQQTDEGQAHDSGADVQVGRGARVATAGASGAGGTVGAAVVGVGVV